MIKSNENIRLKSNTELQYGTYNSLTVKYSDPFWFNFSGKGPLTLWLSKCTFKSTLLELPLKWVGVGQLVEGSLSFPFILHTCNSRAGQFCFGFFVSSCGRTTANPTICESSHLTDTTELQREGSWDYAITAETGSKSNQSLINIRQEFSLTCLCCSSNWTQKAHYFPFSDNRLWEGVESEVWGANEATRGGHNQSMTHVCWEITQNNCN